MGRVEIEQHRLHTSEKGDWPQKTGTDAEIM